MNKTLTTLACGTVLAGFLGIVHTFGVPTRPDLEEYSTYERVTPYATPIDSLAVQDTLKTNDLAYKIQQDANAYRQ